jgi:rhomboid family protein
VIPLDDDNPTLRVPIVTILLIVITGATWLFVQGAGLDPVTLGRSICNLGLVAGEITGKAAVGTSVPIGEGLTCVVDHDPINYLTPLTSMFLHGGWMHIIGNCVFLWVFGNNVEDSMGRGRFVAFYLLCGLAAAAAQVAAQPDSPVPMVGASGAISGVMGAYLVLYPNARVKTLIPLIIYYRIVWLPAWFFLLYWFALQVIDALPELAQAQATVESGVAVMAHIGGFLTGALLVRLFQNDRLLEQRIPGPLLP